jgi:hypothetical protein
MYGKVKKKGRLWAGLCQKRRYAFRKLYTRRNSGCNRQKKSARRRILAGNKKMFQRVPGTGVPVKP